ncbi:c-type cytochrome [Paenibacillus rigui]|uniref:Cytochrome c domain-containing protein n=1 Tax=Paenibacillus rigui TaxID=554312 RepID=A0A229UY10_9BACL|nr:cytochrome c [Paenibacillus rigui]OXM88334.1 hypothetical protein CF651_00255 [Paenibacillus rigui]
MRKHILGATALLVVALLGGCKDAPAVQTPSPVTTDPGDTAAQTVPPKAGTDALPLSGSAGSDAAAAPGGEPAAGQPTPEPAKPSASAPSTSTGSKSKAELPKAELPRLDEPAAKQPAVAPMPTELVTPKSSGTSPAPEAGSGGSKPATAPMPTDLVTPPMAGASSSSSSAKSADGTVSISSASSSSGFGKAEALYKDNCMVCHGDKLQGDIGPNLTKVGTRLTKEQLLAKINLGSKSMPPFQKTLQADQIQELVSWLATQK